MTIRFRRLLLAALLIAAGAAEAGPRDKLWPVVRTCVAAKRLLGIPFPCLAVELPENDMNKGYVVLRPFKLDDLILSPTRESVGVEDPFLESPAAPNYFAAAWRARSFLKDPDGAQPERDEVLLVVNSKRARSQDQLHIHIGCLSPADRKAFGEIARKLPRNRWSQLERGFAGVRVREADFAALNPFSLAIQGFEGAAQNPGMLSVSVIGARVDGEDDFLILATFDGVRGQSPHASAESLLDKRCTAPSPLG